ncbi:hypothetical protein [Burkholderia sp. SCN-KJ]|uniref:hypothetical protein n=1 Tax=Burkholderia sp. SCN-KJ TaxID=2969248 RepID=UPI00214FEA14|nr:hypothetical protein [Burkholderia sp. SCN-KJ]MCR4470012.1 hypothetical protein [Burkholderia sp. SCN-KJ]
MNCIAIRAIKFVTGAATDIYARLKNIASGPVPNTFTALGHFAPASLAAQLSAEGVLTSGGLTEISLAVALTVLTNISQRINGTVVDFPPVE